LKKTRVSPSHRSSHRPVADLRLGEVSRPAVRGDAPLVGDAVAVVVDAISADLLALAARTDALGPGAEFAVEEARLRAADAGPNPREAGVACEARLPLAACARAVLVDAAVSVVVQPVARLAALPFRRDVGLSALAVRCGASRVPRRGVARRDTGLRRAAGRARDRPETDERGHATRDRPTVPRTCVHRRTVVEVLAKMPA
jgi:hypothetical protein